MIFGNEIEKAVWEKKHQDTVKMKLTAGFTKYFSRFTKEDYHSLIASSLKTYDQERPAYDEFLDRERLSDYEGDEETFKSDMRKKCPIMRRCLGSTAEVMKAFKRDYNLKPGKDLWKVTVAIVDFGNTYRDEHGESLFQNYRNCEDLRLDALIDENKFSLGVIGNGIQAHFLYMIEPRIFPNRSQLATWSLYFMTDKDTFGLKEASEFIMVYADKTTAEQNFFYDQRLFFYYEYYLMHLLESKLAEIGYTIDTSKRFVVLDAFNDFIGSQHGSEIATLKGWDDEERYW